MIAVTSIENVADASFQMLLDDYIFYRIKFNAVVFRPFKNEVLDGIVEQTNKLGLFVSVGPLKCFISRKSMPESLNFDGSKYTKSDKNYVIEVSTPLRFKVIGHRVDPLEIFAIGTLRDDYLGPISRNTQIKIEQEDHLGTANKPSSCDR